MRFVHVNHRYSPFVGGSERWVQEISESLARSGHDLSVVTTDAFDLEYFWDRRQTRVEADRRDCIGGVSIERVPVRHLPFSSVAFRGTRRLMGEASVLPLPAWAFRAVSATQPYLPELEAAIETALPADLVLATNIGIESLAIRALKIASKRDIPFVLTPFIHLGVGERSNARRYVTMPHQRDLLASADAIIVMTHVEREFVERYRRGRGAVVVAGAGVEIPEVTGGSRDRFAMDVPTSGFLVGAIGAMAQDKGTMDLASAVIELRRQGHDVELVLAGPPLQGFLRWYAGLSDHERMGIHVLGFISADVKRDMLAAIDVLALPSRTESFGIVYLEAWANAKPVIASDTPATRELIQHEHTGLLTTFGDRDAIASSILRLKRNDDERDELGRNGHDVTIRCHTWQHVIGRVNEVYSDVLGIDVGESASL